MRILLCYSTKELKEENIQKIENEIKRGRGGEWRRGRGNMLPVYQTLFECCVTSSRAMRLSFLCHFDFIYPCPYPFSVTVPSCSSSIPVSHLRTCIFSQSERERARKSANQPQLALTDATNAKLFPLCVCLYVQCFVSMLVCKCVCVCLCVYVCVALTLFVLQADRCSLRQH